MKLYGYWRSGTSYRVRVALALKGVQVEQVAVNLLEAEHKGEEYLALNPQGLVPSLILDDGTVINQSPAILEYIDEALAGPDLLPKDALGRAKARQYAAMIGCDIHPVQNLRILKYIQNELGHERDEAFNFAAHWIDVGFAAMEEQLSRDSWSGPFVMGEKPTLPDCYLLPQLYAGRRFGASVERYTKLLKIEEALNALPAVAAAHPDQQADAQV
ncbi:maleylacetoacetate isomerase [Parvularcula sp. ZS-1/3]|uniref:Maleylacetoacetate isomerase n=1 Tax=Parvularcula mediterranea TaxID=2732508 RepID=A0A7Y3RJM9_9PROT|nr:maleylacetoacetate isomerase [Parvularcula mediterranea]NNU15205.1 maleylacetoacetate isomerase [Parvularcula mediterranea]